MPRYYAPITKDELRTKIQTELGETAFDSYRNLQRAFGADLKVEFDFENFSRDADDFGPDGLMGYRSFASGLTFLGCAAGGDWEHPVFFVIYFDGTRLRLYVPTDGNPWNTDTHRAYGNDEDADLINARKRWPGHFTTAESADAGDFSFDEEQIRADLGRRLAPAR